MKLVEGRKHLGSCNFKDCDLILTHVTKEMRLAPPEYETFGQWEDDMSRGRQMTSIRLQYAHGPEQNRFECLCKQGITCWMRPCAGRWYTKRTTRKRQTNIFLSTEIRRCWTAATLITWQIGRCWLDYKCLGPCRWCQSWVKKTPKQTNKVLLITCQILRKAVPEWYYPSQNFADLS